MKKSAEVIILNDLIRIHNDRAAGYKKINETLTEEYIDLKVFFNQCVMESKLYANKLERIVIYLGGDAADDIITGTIYKIWMDVQAVFSGHTQSSILQVCEFSEHALQKAYSFALEATAEISDDTMDILEDQQFALNEAYKNMKLRVIPESV